MSDNLTIYQQFKQLELQEEEQVKECVAAIKAIHAAGGHPFDKQSQSKGQIYRGKGNVQKYSPSCEPIGWYRSDQKSGLPNRLMPIEQDLKEQYQQYKKSVISAFPKSATASILGTRSGKVRKENGLRQKIIELNQQLILNDIPKHHRANLIAKKLVCNTEYARRILRQVNNTN